MRRRHILLLPAWLAVPLPAAAMSVSEVRVGIDAARAWRMAARLGVLVRGVQDGMVAALNAGHLELALLTRAELAEARLLMGERLLELPGAVEGRTAVTRRVLPAGLRARLADALV